MKVRNILIGLLVVLMAFVFISCEDEPEEGGQTPAVQVDDTIYKFTTTKGVSDGVFSHDKFSVRFNEAVEEGETISFEFRSTVDFFQVSVRSIEGSTKYVYEQDIKDDGTNSFTLEPLSDGWTKFSYTFAENAAASKDFRIDLRGWLATGDVMEFRHVFYAGEQLALSAESMGSYGAPTMEVVEDSQWDETDNKIVAIFIGKPDSADKYPVVESVAKGGKATLSGLVKDNYNLMNVYWYDKSGNKGEVFNKDTDVIEADTFLLAEWKGVDVDITFHKNYLGAENEELVTTTEVGKAITPPATDDWERDGWKITGWTTAAVATEDNVFDDNAPVASTDAIEIYAQWSNVATLTLNMNYGAVPATKEIDVTIGEAPVGVAQVGRPGYLLSGWTVGPASDSGAYDYNSVVTGDKTIYAQWVEPEHTYELTSTIAVEAIKIPADSSNNYTNKYYQFRWRDNDTNVPNRAGGQLLAGDVISFMVKFTPVEGSAAPDTVILLDKDSGAIYSGSFGPADANGWISFSYTLTAQPGAQGLKMKIQRGASGSPAIEVGDKLEFKGLSLNGVALALATDNTKNGLYEGCKPELLVK